MDRFEVPILLVNPVSPYDEQATAKRRPKPAARQIKRRKIESLVEPCNIALFPIIKTRSAQPASAAKVHLRV